MCERIPRIAGYEYEYDFSIKEELVSANNHKLEPGVDTTLIFEIKTSFIIKTINGEDEIIDSEVLSSVFGDTGSEFMWVVLDCYLTGRFNDYWMTYDEIKRFGVEAIDYARRAADAADHPRVVPVFADVKVRTVQLDGETVGAAMDRALRAEYLVPFFTIPYPTTVDSLLAEFLGEMKKTRVADIDVGLAIMRACDICSRGPRIGGQISRVRTCGHALHSHCYARWLLKGNTHCPSCGALAYDSDWSSDDEL